jgi:hypothetical protein
MSPCGVADEAGGPGAPGQFPSRPGPPGSKGIRTRRGPSYLGLVVGARLDRSQRQRTTTDAVATEGTPTRWRWLARLRANAGQAVPIHAVWLDAAEIKAC